MKKKISTVLTILAVLIVTTNFSAHNRSFELDDSYNEMTGKMIERELHEFQYAIEFQEENGWTSPYMVREKIDDVVGGIFHTNQAGMDFDWVTRSQEGLFRKFSVFLWGRDGIRMMTLSRKSSIGKLQDVFAPYHHPEEWPYEGEAFSDEERESLIQLSSDLKKADLGMARDVSIRSDYEFDAAVKTLYTLQLGEEGRVAAQSVSP